MSIVGNSMVLKSLVTLLFSYLLTLLFGHFFIKGMLRKKISQPINPDGPQTHFIKAGTPTSGGLFFIAGICLSLTLFGNFKNPYLYLPLLAILLFGLIGLIDDLIKIKRKESIGLTTLQKLAMQILAAALLFYLYTKATGKIDLLLNNSDKRFGTWYPMVFLIYVVTIVNAVNISDGLDGLAVGIALSPLLLLAIITTLVGIGVYKADLLIGMAEESFNLLLVLSGVIGSVLAFLWYNGAKAQVFMGDVGSHALGAIIAVSALLLKVEVVILIASALFFIEVLSSLLQIISIRVFSRRLFFMAPLHHHFEKKGISEERIVVRFQIASALATVTGALLFMTKIG
jgi:phospho-N-acetylmuramoyl-pentapeptide-transferase